MSTSYYSNPKTIDYAALDWSKPDWKLAMQTGRSNTQIRLKRKELGKAKVPVGKISNTIKRK